MESDSIPCTASDDPDETHHMLPASPYDSDSTWAMSTLQEASSTDTRGRVRFVSRAAEEGPPHGQPTTPPRPVVTADKVTRPTSILRENSSGNVITLSNDDAVTIGNLAASAAQVRGIHMADRVRQESAHRESVDSTIYDGQSQDDWTREDARAAYTAVQRIENISEGHTNTANLEQNKSLLSSNAAACKIVQDYSRRATNPNNENTTVLAAKHAPEAIYNRTYDGTYNVEAPQSYRGGILSQLLKLTRQQEATSKNREFSPGFNRHERDFSTSSMSGLMTSGTSTSGATTPKRKWYDHNDSGETLTNLIAASAKLANPGKSVDNIQSKPSSKTKFNSSQRQNEAYITVHIAGILSRQNFILQMCKALMLYGAPTHRLEEYLTMTARALEIEASFLYLPGCMIIAFDDPATHTTEVKLVRLAQGIDLGRLKDVHRIYKEVLHDVIGVDEATEQLDELMARPNKFHPWFRVFIFGLTSVFAGPFSFKARLIDLPACFVFGCLVGFLQLIAAPRLSLYSNVFEVTATVLVTFCARALGSIRGGDLFCFSSIAQSGIVMLLPGYMFLSSSLELQARAIIPGSIRIVYGVIYSLLLGFGITIGSALYGLFDKNATSSVTCTAPIDPYIAFAFVPPFVVCITILYQSKWQQVPVMTVIAFAGYLVNYFSSIRFASSAQIAGTIGAFAVGILANVYARMRHGVAAAILVPAIFTQVPGSLSSQGGLLSGLMVADQINNITMTETSNLGTPNLSTSVAFSVAGNMTQITVAITVGLFLSALLVWPFGKRRSALFSF